MNSDAIKSSKSENKLSAQWWEKVLVAVLFILALIYTHYAKAANEGGQCQTKTIQALARICMSRGEYEKAEKFIDKAIAIAATDEDKSSCLIDRAWIYKNLQQYKQAEQLCLQGLQLQQQLYNPDHPYIAYTLRVLGSIYQAQGDFKSAFESFNKAISIIRKYYPEGDPVIASFEIDTARLLAAEGDFLQAELQYERALAVIIDFYGSENLYTAQVFSDLARLYYLQGRLNEAESILEYSLDIQQQIYDRNILPLIVNRLTLTGILKAEGQFSRARDLLNNTLSSLEMYPTDSLPVQKGELWTALADLEFDSGNFSEAFVACNRAIDALEKVVGTNSELTATALNCRARIYIMQGQLDKAYQFGCEALGLLESSVSTSHTIIAAINRTILLSQELEPVAFLARADGWLNSTQ